MTPEERKEHQIKRPEGITDEEYELYKSLPIGDFQRVLLRAAGYSRLNGIGLGVATYEGLAEGKVVRLA